MCFFVFVFFFFGGGGPFCVVSFIAHGWLPWNFSQALRRHFGFSALKQFQVAVLGAWAEGKDVPLGWL